MYQRHAAENEGPSVTNALECQDIKTLSACHSSINIASQDPSVKDGSKANISYYKGTVSDHINSASIVPDPKRC